MKIMLLERVERLGQMGDLVEVKNGYARNYLLPRGKAARATAENRARFERDRAEIEARNLERKQEAETVAAKIQGLSVIIIRQASESGNLYGSVTPRNIAEACEAMDLQIDRHQIVLERALKALGLHDVRIIIHPEVDATIQINLARSEEDARLQAQGLQVGGEVEEAAREFDALSADEDALSADEEDSSASDPEDPTEPPLPETPTPPDTADADSGSD